MSKINFQSNDFKIMNLFEMWRGAGMMERRYWIMGGIPCPGAAFVPSSKIVVKVIDLFLFFADS